MAAVDYLLNQRPPSRRDPMNAACPPPDQRTSSVDPSTFRSVLGRFVTGVTVITTRAPDGRRAGVTVSSFNTLSLDPPLILFSLALKAPSLSVFRAADRFAVNILAEGQEHIARQFARPADDKFEGIEVEDGVDEVPLIAGALAHLECDVTDRYPGGDHEIVLGRLHRTSASERAPLVYHRGQFGQFTGG
jgi:flavin reductase (DIM6/NTAB) family NADH-FMN oxidoreductase RutF